MILRHRYYLDYCYDTHAIIYHWDYCYDIVDDFLAIKYHAAESSIKKLEVDW